MCQPDAATWRRGTMESGVSADGRVTKAKKRGKKEPPPPKQEMHIKVDALADLGTDNSACSVVNNLPEPSAPGSKDGTCSLRAAIQTANGMAGAMRIVVLLRSGRYRLTSALPEISGEVELRGSIQVRLR